MRKLFLTFACIIGLSSFALAQKGQTQLNAGVGFDSWKGVPIYVGFDHYVSNDFSLGAEVSHVSLDKYKKHKHDYSIWGIGGNANYHFDRVLSLPSDWNIYAGLNLTYYSWDHHDHHDNDGLNLGAQIGARYFFSRNFGLNLQAGGGSNVSGGKFGITYRF